MISVALTAAVPAKGQNIVKNNVSNHSKKKKINEFNYINYFHLKASVQHCSAMRVNLLYHIVSMQVPLLTPQIHCCLCVGAKTLDAPSVHCTLQLHEAES